MIRTEPTKGQQQSKKEGRKEEGEREREKWNEQSLKVKCNEHRGKPATMGGIGRQTIKGEEEEVAEDEEEEVQ